MKRSNLFGRTNTVLLALLMLAGLVLIGCEKESDDIPSGPAITVDRLIEEGWQHYNDNETSEAITSFSDAANADATSLEAYLGMGYAFAANAELNRALQNFGNVITLADILYEDPANSYANSLRAEAYAGMATSYLAGHEFSVDNLDDAIANAEAAIAIWSEHETQEHRWIEGMGIADMKFTIAEAHYVAERYHLCMYMVDELSQDLAGTSFVENAQHISATTEVVDVALLEDTWSTGQAELYVSETNLIDPYQVLDGDDHECQVMAFESAGSMVLFRANPVPTMDDSYTVNYYYADAYGAFLIEMRNKLDELKQM